MILVTGGAGFIGANFILDWLRVNDEPVLNLDKLTYAGNCENLAELAGDPRYAFVQGDIGDPVLVGALLIRLQGVNPWYAYRTLFGSALLTPDGLLRTLRNQAVMAFRQAGG